MSFTRYWIMFFVLLILFSLPLAIACVRWFRAHTPQARRESGVRLLGACRRQCKPLACMTGIYLVALSALIRANIDYKDDIHRIFTGTKGWKAFSRYLAQTASVFLHGDYYLMDISPLPQLLAMVMMAAASLAVIRLISRERKVTLWGLIGAVPLGLCPYFLECFSYKYDAPYMAISVLASVLPLLLSGQSALIYTSAVALGSLLMCASYQSASGILPMLVLALCLLRWVRGESPREVGRFLLRSVAGYAVALLAFKLFVVHPVEDYVSNTLPPLGQLIPNTLSNLAHYYRLVASDFKPAWLILTALLALAFAFVVVRDARGRRPLALLGAVAALALMFLLAFGVYPLLSAPQFAPRGMYGFGALLAILCVTVATARRAYPAKLACLALSWMFITFALTYGNVLHVQDEYTNFRIAATVEDLSHLDAFTNDETKMVQISGSIDFTPAYRNMPRDNNMIERLISLDFNGDWPFGPLRLYGFYGMRNLQWEGGVDLTQRDLPVLLDTMYHTIRGDGHYFLVELK